MDTNTNTCYIDDTALEEDIQQIKSSLCIELVRDASLEKTWDTLIKQYHYLGSSKAMGPRLKYIVWLDNRIVSAIGFNQAVLRLGVRDRFIDWKDEEKQRYLRHVLNNNRFLIMPWIKIKNLASHVMSLAINQLKDDWKNTYGSEVYVLETFVDVEKYIGTCYKASNWRYIGKTSGFKKVGKTYEYHGNHKAVYLYFVKKNYKNLIECTGRPIRNLKKRRKPLEKVTMQLQTNNWHPELIKEANVKNIAKTLPEMFSNHMNRFVECFPKAEHEFNANIYVRGLLSNIERKSIEPISLEFNPDKRGVRNLQFFMKNAQWNDKEATRIYQREFLQKVSDPNGMITVDESGNRKKGNNSVGVASQYCGNIGKVDNSQVGVYVGYSSNKGYGLLSSRLFMPEKWFGNDYKSKREECLVPDNLEFKTKPQIATELIEELESTGLLNAKWVGADCLYGNNKEFLKSIPSKYFYFVDIPSDSCVWSLKPEFFLPEYKGRGRKNTKKIPTIKPQKVADIAKDDGMPWERVCLGKGSKGDIYSNINCIRIFRDFSEENSEPEVEECWLFIRQREDGEIRYSVSNAPAGIDKSELCSASLMRWPIEQCFDEMKGSLGLDHCEARSWPAWHRHTLWVFIAFEFLIGIRLLVTDKKKSNFVIKNGVNASNCIFQ